MKITEKKRYYIRVYQLTDTENMVKQGENNRYFKTLKLEASLLTSPRFSSSTLQSDSLPAHSKLLL